MWPKNKNHLQPCKYSKISRTFSVLISYIIFKYDRLIYTDWKSLGSFHLTHFNDTNTEELHLIFRSWNIPEKVNISAEVFSCSEAVLVKDCQKQQQQIWVTDANTANHRRESAKEAGLMRVVVQSNPSPSLRQSVSNSASLTGRSGRSVISVKRSCVLINVSEASLLLIKSVEWRSRVNFSPVASTSIPTPLLAAILAVWHPRTRSLVFFLFGSV